MKLRYPLILASQSPRRRKLLEERGFSPSIMPANIDETFDDTNEFQQIAVELSKKKAEFVEKSLPAGRQIVLAADTVVVFENMIYGKPKNKIEAEEFLMTLKNNVHQVCTGITIMVSGTSEVFSSYEITDVFFDDISINMINEYIKNGHPFDKAGGYGIQDMGAFFVKRVEGCFFNVVGLPLNLFYKGLEKLDLIIWK